MKRRHLLLLICVISCLAGSVLLAESAGEDLEGRVLRHSSDGPGNNRGWAGELAAIVIALAVVLAAVYLLLRVLRRFFPSLAPAADPAAAVKPLARFHLAPRQTLHLVRCGSRLLLLGATSASINHIATIDDAAEIDLILQAVGRGQSPFKTFGKFFGRSSDDKRSPAAQDGSNEVQEQ